MPFQRPHAAQAAVTSSSRSAWPRPHHRMLDRKPSLRHGRNEGGRVLIRDLGLPDLPQPRRAAGARPRWAPAAAGFLPAPIACSVDGKPPVEDEARDEVTAVGEAEEIAFPEASARERFSAGLRLGPAHDDRRDVLVERQLPGLRGQQRCSVTLPSEEQSPALPARRGPRNPVPGPLRRLACS